MAGDIGKRVEQARLMMRPVQMRPADLARALSVSRQTVDNWLKGRSNPPSETLPRIAELLGVTVEFLMGISNSEVHSDGAKRFSAKAPRGRIKIYGYISAGNGDCSDHSPFDDIPYDFNRDDYGAMMVEGDSMYPFLEPSDIVIFRDWKTERLSHIFAAEISDNQWVVKQLAYKDGRFVLRSLNDKYPDYEGPFRLAGYLVGIIRDRGNERLIRMNPQGLLPD